MFFRGSLDQAVKGFAPNPASRAVRFHNNEKALEIERRPMSLVIWRWLLILEQTRRGSSARLPIVSSRSPFRPRHRQ